MRKPISKALRYRVLERDGYQCVYCGATPSDGPLHIDHVIPVSKGGTNVFSNLVAACLDCNLGKRNSLPGDFIENQRVYAGAAYAYDIAAQRFGAKAEPDFMEILLNCMGEGNPDPYLSIVRSAPSWPEAKRLMDHHFYRGEPPVFKLYDSHACHGAYEDQPRSSNDNHDEIVL